MRIRSKHLLLAWALALLAAAPAHALRVATWNLTQYQDGRIPSQITPRQADFRTAVAGLQPDILIAQELQGSTSCDSFRVNVLNFLQPGQWSSSYIVSTESGVFWRTPVVDVTNVMSFSDGGGYRDVLECWVHPAGYADKMATFRLFSIHLKAGTTPADAVTRNTECTGIRNTINTQSQVNYGPNFLIGGDTNFQGGTGVEAGYSRLTESQSNNNGQCHDTLGTLPSTWHDNWYLRYYHSQSPCTTPLPYPYFAGGGLDDRFDLFLTSNSVQDGQGLDLHGYITYGQDGRHMNDNINASGNDSVGYTIATALHNAADHIPVVAVIRLPAKVSAASQLDFGTVITGATAEQPLAVTNGASWPGDSLRYSFSAPAGFTAPSGNFAQAVAAPPTNQTIAMNTASAGSHSGTLTLASNDVDSSSKSVLLSGLVLRHAVASLDSLTVLLADTLDFGDVPLDSFPDLPVRIFNQGYDPLQARLSVTAGNISGGDGHFSIVGGFSGALVAGTPASYAIRFDTTGATIGTNYYATLTFSDADETLPGAQPQPDLVVTLRAKPWYANADVPGGLPKTLHFYPPRPNPASGPIRFAYDLPKAAPVKLEVFDLSGRRVASLVSGEVGAGHHNVSWNPGGRSAGVAGLYFARFSTPGMARTVRLVMLP